MLFVMMQLSILSVPTSPPKTLPYHAMPPPRSSPLFAAIVFLPLRMVTPEIDVWMPALPSWLISRTLSMPLPSTPLVDATVPA